MFWPFFQNVHNHSIKLIFSFTWKSTFSNNTMALFDCFALNIDKITDFWNFGLFWPSLAFIGLYDLFWPFMIF